MKLVIDIGNSHLKWATIDAGKFIFGGSHPHKKQDTQQLLATIWQHIKPDKIAVANVGGEKIAAILSEFVQQTWHKTVTFITAKTASHGIKNTYATPLLLGADRWADVIAAWQICHGPVAIFDAGTSITLDIVDSKGNLLGGTISPGLNLMCDSLVAGADGLKSMQGSFFQAGEKYSVSLAAKDTRSNITSGALLSAVGFLKQSALDLLTTENAMQFFVTGGDAIFLMPYLPDNFEYQPYLALQGVNILSENNK